MTMHASARTVLMALALLAGSVSIATAAPKASKVPKLSATYDKCMDRSKGVTVEMHDCIDAEYERQDARLNDVYKSAMARLSPAEQTKLRNTERAWLKTIKTHCDHAGDDNQGGTLQVIEIADCYLKETAKRADVLTSFRP
jgi:uncharacterized protein YecT (DUF1311 family)